MTLVASLLIAGALLEAAPRPTHFDVKGSYSAPRSNSPGAVAVQFVARDPDVKINEVPAPRLKLTSGPATPVEAARPAPMAREGEAGAASGHYLDLTLPVIFPVKLDPATPRGTHDAKGTVTYFYCSKREGWCRKGSAEVAFPVSVP